jgi:ornithine--oxo-acid transaminase
MFKNLLKINAMYGAQNYNPLPVVLKQGYGIYLVDVFGKRYIDFLSSYGSVNQGHCHPKLIKVMNEQSTKLTLCSRAFHSESLIRFYQHMHSTFGYDKCLPMNTGVEGGETALKLARLWGYQAKHIQKNKAVILMAQHNFWGRTITACSSSTDPLCYTHFGPYTPGFDIVKYNDIDDLHEKFSKNPNIVAYMVEPIQGEAGIILPTNDYLKKVRKLCNKYNVLLICDEVQTGIGRTGKMLASDVYGIRPDILILGKSLSGGMLPISCVLADNNIMDLIKPGMHGSTYGGNPLACEIAMESLDIVKDENLLPNAKTMGIMFRGELDIYNGNQVKDIRGVGLMNAIEFHTAGHADIFVDSCMNNGLLTKITRDKTVRMCPPLIITKFQMSKSLDIIVNAINKI